MSKKNVLSQKKKRAAVTEENRQMAGFTGSEDEYLVIPPEMVVDGEVVAVDSIGRKAFSGCGKLHNVVVLNGVKTIGAEAFSCCSSLQSVDLPDGLRSISTEAFKNCVSLGEIHEAHP